MKTVEKRRGEGEEQKEENVGIKRDCLVTSGSKGSAWSRRCCEFEGGWGHLNSRLTLNENATLFESQPLLAACSDWPRSSNAIFCKGFSN